MRVEFNPVSQLWASRSRVFALGVDSEPVEVEFCVSRVVYVYISRNRFWPLGVVDFKFLHT